MSAFCAECGNPLPSGSKSCGRCGAQQALARRAGDPAYGMLDLDRTEGTEGSLALDVAEDPRPRKNRPQGRPDSGPVRATPGNAASNATGRTVRAASGNVTGRSQATTGATARTQGASKSSATLAASKGNATLGASKSNATLSASKNASAVKSPASGTSRSVALPASRMPATVVGVAAAGGGASTLVGNAAPAVEPAWGGTMLGDNPFDDTFARTDETPSLEIDEAADPRHRWQTEEAPEGGPSPAEQRAARVRELAAYGPPPKNIFGTMGYCVRVTLRKRVLDDALAALSAQRKRTDDAARDALAKLGESLHSKRRDPRLATLARQLEAVSSAEAAIGSVEKAGAQRKQSIQRERVQIEAQTKGIEADAAPLRERVASLSGHVDEYKASIRRADAQRRKLEQEIEGLRKKPGADLALHVRLKAERDAVHGEVQTLGLQLGPLEDELVVVREELAVQVNKLDALQQGQQAATSALERAQQTQRVSSGSARGARRDALSALAQVAIDNGLAAIAPDDLQAVRDANERRDSKRAEEELHRAATRSFKEDAYKQGMLLLVGGTGALFLSLILVVIF